VKRTACGGVGAGRTGVGHALGAVNGVGSGSGSIRTGAGADGASAMGTGTLRVGAVGTLRDGAAGTLRDGAGGVQFTPRGSGVATPRWAGGLSSMGTWRGGAVMLVSNVIRSRSALDWVSVRGAKAEAGAGFCNACAISLRQAMMISVEELAGIRTFVGYHVSVSQIRSARVSVIQML
jgi:hypothetical protein